jgi:uncharacterized protein YllA (UPF0747 family)
MMRGLEHLNGHQLRNVEEIQQLMPYLSFFERLEWVQHIRPWFNDDFVLTSKILCIRINNKDIA